MSIRILPTIILFICLPAVALAADDQAESSRNNRDLAAASLFDSGKYPQALAAYQSLLKEKPDSLKAHLGISRTYLEMGEYDAAEKELEFFNAITKSAIGNFTASELLDFSKGLWLFATRKGDKELFHKIASEYLPRVEQLDKKSADLYVFWGECYLEKGDIGEAISCFRDALKIEPKIAPALMGLANASLHKDPLSARQPIAQILKLFPDYPDATALQSILYLIEENHDAALESINKALTVTPNSAYYRGIRAGVYYLNNQLELFQKECDDILAVNKSPAVFYLTLGNCCMKRILYMDAQPFYQKAIELDPHCWEGYVSLGLNSLRLGPEPEAQGRKLLEESFQRDPFNLTVFNTLKVLEGLESEYETITTTHFAIKMHKSERALLEPYVTELMEQCYDKFTKLYQFEPETPLVAEVYENHNDFSVRTLGLPGFGALGVCFAKTFLVLSPSVQDQLVKRFHWGAITAHEFMHVITLQMSRFRVPRWFTEGCSVYAEKLANPAWGREPQAEIIAAYQQGKLQHLTQFGRTKQVDLLHTYLLSSIIIEYIHKTYGMDKIIRMLQLFAQGKKADAAFQECIGKNMEEFDKEFFKYLEETVIKGNDIKGFEARFKKAQELYFADKYAEAIAEFNEAKKLFPLNIKPQDNPYYYLIRIYEEIGDDDKLVKELEDFVKINQLDFGSRQKLYRIYRTNKQTDKLIALINETIYLEPENIQMHYYLAEAYTGKKNYPKALGEYNAAMSLVMRLSPTLNRNLVIADFYCNMAEIYLDLGDKTKAKESVLEARKIHSDNKRIEGILKRCE